MILRDAGGKQPGGAAAGARSAPGRRAAFGRPPPQFGGLWPPNAAAPPGCFPLLGRSYFPNVRDGVPLKGKGVEPGALELVPLLGDQAQEGFPVVGKGRAAILEISQEIL